MSAAAAAAAAAAVCYSSRNNSRTQSQETQDNPPVLNYYSVSQPTVRPVVFQNRYESQKRKDWNNFLEYLKNQSPSLTISRCTEAHVVEFLKHLDRSGSTKVHVKTCPFYGRLHASSSFSECECPVQEAYGSVEAIVGRLRAAFQEIIRPSESNLFGSRAVRLYLSDLRHAQDKSRGIVR